MIGFTTHSAMPTRMETDASWTHTAKETAAPFQQSCKNLSNRSQSTEKPLDPRGYFVAVTIGDKKTLTGIGGL